MAMTRGARHHDDRHHDEVWISDQVTGEFARTAIH
jgi:hypothetical protein